MEKNDLISLIGEIIRRGDAILLNNIGITDTLALNRLRAAKRMLLSDSLDAIEFRDVFKIENEGKGKSFSELRWIQGASCNTIKGVRKLCICLYNKDNNYKGEYIPIN